MKYVIGHQLDTGYIFPVVFDDWITHRDIAHQMPKATNLLSAGFLKVDAGKQHIHVYGSSDSLQGLGPSPFDGYILLLFLFQGLSGLQLANRAMAGQVDGRLLPETQYSFQ